MGSEKKRKREKLEDNEVRDGLDKSERKRLRKSKGEDENSGINVEGLDGLASVSALVSPIATPMAGRKLTKKLFKLISHAAKDKCLRRGIKEVVLAIRKEDKGVVVMAGDVFPIDVIAHVPILCEEAMIPYCFVSRKTELGAAGLTKRPTSVVLVSEKKVEGEVKEEMEKVKKEMGAIQNTF